MPTRTVEHLNGVTEVPVQLSRVAALEARGTLETALALGLAVLAVGVEPGLGFPEFLRAAPGADGLEEVAVSGGGVNLEALAALRPDLILSNRSGFESDYDDLSAIAPTLFLPNSREEPWAQTIRTLGAALDRSEQAEASIGRYETERDRLRDRFGPTIADTTVTVFYAGTADGVFGYGTLGLFVQTLLDLGGRLPAGQPEEGQDLSLEQLDRLGGDLLIRLSFAKDDADLETNPLFQALPAVQAGRLITVDGGTANIGSLFSALECLRNIEAAYELVA
ncbi:MAG: ABC transporter substrate-binding protein [Actinomycetota bacterium]